MCKNIQELSSRYICTVMLLSVKREKEAAQQLMEGAMLVLSTKYSHDYGLEGSDRDRIYWLTPHLW